MTERDRLAGLAEQIELARKSIDSWPNWLRQSTHFAGTERDTGAESGQNVNETNTSNQSGTPVSQR